MKVSTAVRHLREGIKSLIRNAWMTFASISAIAISLFILGIFLIMAMNIQQLTKQVEDQVEIWVYLGLSVEEQRYSQIHNDIGRMDQVSRVRFVSKDEGLTLLMERMGEEGEEFAAGFEGEHNPLPDAFVVEVRDIDFVHVVAEDIETLYIEQSDNPIDKISYSKDTVDNLSLLTNWIRNVGLIFVVLLSFTAMFLIANTIKLTIFARRREIAIMKLVGATNGFIRWPFFVEGAFLGLFGGLIPSGVLLYLYIRIVDALRVDMELLQLRFIPYEELNVQVLAVLVFIGMMIGIWGSMISVRKHLRV